MNVIIANDNKELLQGLTIDIIKKMEGQFEVEEIISAFKNFYFQRMIVDITALKNYKDIKTLQKLTIALDMDKVILLLDNSQESVLPDYLSKLISMGIYNFTQNVDGVMYLYNHPNTYRDVAQYHQLDSKVEEATNQNSQAVNLVGPRLIGFKNINKSAGATTLIYMLKKQLAKTQNVVALEVDKHDFTYFREKDLYATTSSELSTTLSKHNGCSVILIDINESVVAENLCTEVYYLLEPSTLKLNKLMMTDQHALAKYKDKKIVLNQSLLSSKDVLDFEYESRMKVFYNMPPLDEREKDIHALNGFLSKMGFRMSSDTEETKKPKLLGIFGI